MAVTSALQDTIPTSLLKLNNDNTGRAVKMFAGIQKYMGESGDPMNQQQRTEVAQRLLHQGLKRPELKDELYMQVRLKSSRSWGGQMSLWCILWPLPPVLLVQCQLGA